MAIGIAEKLMHMTVRLECRLRNGATATGTGFFFAYAVEGKGDLFVIVTNKHVIEGSQSGTFVLTRQGPDGDPVVGSYERASFDNFEALWFKHPSPDVDLAVFPIGPVLNYAQQRGVTFFVPPLVEMHIPTHEVLRELSGIESILMIGYPNGIWDEKNNLPIVRRGLTATSPKFDYDGSPEFLIDCACFPGSSGSPVVIFDQGAFSDAMGNTQIGLRLILLGVLYAGPQHEAEGDIVTVQTSLAKRQIALSRIPNNLGFVVKAQKLQDFKPMLIAFAKALDGNK